MRRLASVLLWSIIAAAFIGPGTVTTAAAAGAAHGYALLWALALSVLATLVLQEAAGRLTVVSGRNLGEAIRESFRGRPSGPLVLLLVLGAIVLGNAAYEAGNILGGTAGAVLGTDLPPRLVTLAIATAAGLLLWSGTPRLVAHVLSVTVAVMGIAFLTTAVLLRPPPGELLSGIALPVFPAGSGLLVLGLVGTTVVPYNLFLGSGIARGQTVGELRFGLAVAVLLGGLVSLGVLVVGASVAGEFSFEALADALTGAFGTGGRILLAAGLFAAGFSSATTAPLAAAITARSLFSHRDGRWSARSWRYRGVWGGVLLAGVGFGLAGVRPIPAIIVAQALNGILLPFAAVFLLVVVNDRGLMGEAVNGPFANAVSAAIVAAAVLLGASSLVRAGFAAVGTAPPAGGLVLTAGLLAVTILAWPVARAVRAARRGESRTRIR